LRISREPPRAVASRRILYFPRQTLSNAEQSLKYLAHQVAIEETSDWIQRSSRQFSVCLLNGGRAFGIRRPLHLYRESVPAALKKANELLSGGFFNVETVMPDGAAHHPASSIN
jgi:hypothetical protein